MPIMPLGNPYVAVVDDDENLRRSFARLLRAAGMRPIGYASAEAFLADTNRPRFDCVVLDVQLPGISGLQLQEQLMGEGAETEILFITAFDDLASREVAFTRGCAGYFRKSDSGKEVLDAIKSVLARRARQA
jgi:FixJ family two-component response regulator